MKGNVGKEEGKNCFCSLSMNKLNLSVRHFYVSSLTNYFIINSVFAILTLERIFLNSFLTIGKLGHLLTNNVKDIKSRVDRLLLLEIVDRPCIKSNCFPHRYSLNYY